MAKVALFIVFAVIMGCASKPTNNDIERKLLQDYVCKETAEVSNLKILKTTETRSTGGPYSFTYSITGEVVWPGGCKEMSTNIPPGTKEKFNRLLILYKSDEGKWE